MSQLPFLLGTQDAAQPLCLLLTRTEGAGDLDGHVGVGQVQGEVGHLGDDKGVQFAVAKLIEQLLPLPNGGLAGDDGNVAVSLSDGPELVQVHAHDEDVVLLVLDHQLIQDRQLARVLGGEAILAPLFGDGVGQAVFVRHGHAYLAAVGAGNPTLLLQILPGHIVLLGANEGKDVSLPAVFPHQRGRQSQATTSLNLSRDAEDRSRQQMHFVVDDQPPIPFIEQSEMGKLLSRWRAALLAPRAIGHDLVGGDGHRPDLFTQPRILTNHLLGQRGFV